GGKLLPLPSTEHRTPLRPLRGGVLLLETQLPPERPIICQGRGYSAQCPAFVSTRPTPDSLTRRSQRCLSLSLSTKAHPACAQFRFSASLASPNHLPAPASSRLPPSSGA